MLMLFFDSGSNRFAVECRWVEEVVPQVTLSPLHRVPDYVVGELNLRGIPVPVVSLGLLLGAEPECDRLHTRIIVLALGDERMIGVRAERVIQSNQVDSSAFVDVGIRVEELPFLTGVLTIEGGEVQQLDVEQLDDFLKPYLFAGRADETA